MRPRTAIRAAGALCALFLAAPGPFASPAEAAVRSRYRAAVGFAAGADSNVLFDGSGGDRLGRGTLSLEGRFADHRWSAGLDLRGTLLGFEERQKLVALGEVLARMSVRTSRLSTMHGRARLRAADDPLSLAQIGLLGTSGRALSLRSSLDFEHRLAPRWTIESSLSLYGLRFLDPVPGAPEGGESLGLRAGLRHRLTRPLTLEGAAEGRVFTSGDWLAGSGALLPGVRWRLARRTFVRASGGPLLYGDAQGVLPLWVGRAGLTVEGRRSGGEILVAHDLTFPAGRGGIIAGQLAEALGRISGERTELRARGGFYRSHPSPRDDRVALGWGVEAGAFYRVIPGTWLGIVGSHFERLATDTEPRLIRDVVFVRLDFTATRP